MRKIYNNITIITKTFKRYNCINRLLASIKKYYPKISIIVSDDNENPIELNGCTQIIMPFDSGLAAGRNASLSKVNTKYFVLIDDDMEFIQQTTLYKMLDILDNNPIDIIGGKINGVEFQGSFETYNGIIRHVANKVVEYINDIPIFHIIPNFFMGDTQKIKYMGGWDEQFKIGGEHGDFMVRCMDNIKIGYCKDVVINHKHETYDNYKTFRNRTTFGKNWFVKHGFHTVITRNGDIIKAEL